MNNKLKHYEYYKSPSGLGTLYCGDCMDIMPLFENGYFDLCLTDVPYDMVNRDDNGLRNFNKKDADEINFPLSDFINVLWNKIAGTTIIFCSPIQLGSFYDYYLPKQKKKKGTVRQIIWKKSNPSPMNGDYIYLSGVENAVWFRKSKATFNAHCKNTVFEYPTGSSKLHPTEKNHELIGELMEDNSNPGDIIIDTCSGSGSHLLQAEKLNRRWVGIEISEKYCELAKQRIDKEARQGKFNL